MNWGKEGLEIFLLSTGDGVREESKTTAGVLLTEPGMRLGDWIPGAEGEVWISLQPTCCPDRSGPWANRLPVGATFWDRAVSWGRVVRRGRSVCSTGDGGRAV